MRSEAIENRTPALKKGGRVFIDILMASHVVPQIRQIRRYPNRRFTLFGPEGGIFSKGYSKTEGRGRGCQLDSYVAAKNLLAEFGYLRSDHMNSKSGSGT